MATKTHTIFAMLAGEIWATIPTVKWEWQIFRCFCAALTDILRTGQRFRQGRFELSASFLLSSFWRHWHELWRQILSHLAGFGNRLNVIPRIIVVQMFEKVVIHLVCSGAEVNENERNRTFQQILKNTYFGHKFWTICWLDRMTQASNFQETFNPIPK